MNRNDFLKTLGLGGAALVAVYCTGCSDNGGIKPSNNVDFTLDLTTPANAALNTNGGYVISNNVVVARTNSGTFVAVTQVCSHEGRTNVSYRKSSNDFYCNVHGATYDTMGKGSNSDGKNGLTTYQTAHTGTSLRVFS